MNHLCPHCRTMQPPTHFACRSGRKGGMAQSEAKTAACRANAKKPRPRTKDQ